MIVERIRPAVFQLTLHAYELAAFVAAARMAVSGTENELTPEARAQLERLLAEYDHAVRNNQGTTY